MGLSLVFRSLLLAIIYPSTPPQGGKKCRNAAIYFRNHTSDERTAQKGRHDPRQQRQWRSEPAVRMIVSDKMRVNRVPNKAYVGLTLSSACESEWQSVRGTAQSLRRRSPRAATPSGWSAPPPPQPATGGSAAGVRRGGAVGPERSGAIRKVRSWAGPILGRAGPTKPATSGSGLVPPTPRHRGRGEEGWADYPSRSHGRRAHRRARTGGRGRRGEGSRASGACKGRRWKAGGWRGGWV